VHDHRQNVALNPSFEATDHQTKTLKLPYQANLQAELIHLQAETEALLQHLRMLKHRRTVEISTQDKAAATPTLVTVR
jgi:hypothetical protein